MYVIYILHISNAIHAQFTKPSIGGHMISTNVIMLSPSFAVANPISVPPESHRVYVLVLYYGAFKLYLN